MPTLTVSRTSTKPREALWEVIADFPNIANWFSGVKTSVSTSTDERGIGATRFCELSPAGALDERVLEWEEGRRVVVSVDQAAKAPVKTAVADFSLTETADGVVLGVDYEFTPKGGALGRAVSPAMTKAISRAFTKFLDDWEAAA